MIYGNYSSIPKWSVPLNSLADKSIPGDSTVPIVVTGQWGGGGYYGPDPRDIEYEKRARLREILNDDNEIFEMLSAIMPTLN